MGKEDRACSCTQLITTQWKHRVCGGIGPPFLTSVLDGGAAQFHASAALLPGKLLPLPTEHEAYVSLRAYLDAIERKRIFLLPAIKMQPLTVPTELSLHLL